MHFHTVSTMRGSNTAGGESANGTVCLMPLVSVSTGPRAVAMTLNKSTVTPMPSWRSSSSFFFVLARGKAAIGKPHNKRIPHEKKPQSQERSCVEKKKDNVPHRPHSEAWWTRTLFQAQASHTRHDELTHVVQLARDGPPRPAGTPWEKKKNHPLAGWTPLANNPLQSRSGTDQAHTIPDTVASKLFIFFEKKSPSPEKTKDFIFFRKKQKKK